MGLCAWVVDAWGSVDAWGDVTQREDIVQWGVAYGEHLTAATWVISLVLKYKYC